MSWKTWLLHQGLCISRSLTYTSNGQLYVMVDDYLITPPSFAADAGILTCHNLHILGGDGNTGGAIITRKAAEIGANILVLKMLLKLSFVLSKWKKKSQKNQLTLSESPEWWGLWRWVLKTLSCLSDQCFLEGLLPPVTHLALHWTMAFSDHHLSAHLRKHIKCRGHAKTHSLETCTSLWEDLPNHCPGYHTIDKLFSHLMYTPWTGKKLGKINGCQLSSILHSLCGAGGKALFCSLVLTRYSVSVFF